jgi:hypothetical protein
MHLLGSSSDFDNKHYYQLTKQATNKNCACPLKNSFYRNEGNRGIKRHWEEGFEWCFGTLVKIYFAIYLWLCKQQHFPLFLERYFVTFQDNHSQHVFVFPASEFSNFPGNGWPWTTPSFSPETIKGRGVNMREGCPKHRSRTACTTIGSFDIRNLGPRYGYVAAYCHFEKQHPDFLLAFEAISQFTIQNNSLDIFVLPVGIKLL